MKIQHCADSHGFFPDLSGDFDCVVHSGDIFPWSNNGRGINRNRTKKQREIDHQRYWTSTHAETIKGWVKGKPILYCAGNHDFYNPCELLNKLGVEVIDLTNRTVEYAGLRWHGFPYVNFLVGEWNWELDPSALYEKTQYTMNKIAGDVDILVAHAPIYQTLDLTDDGEYMGNR